MWRSRFVQILNFAEIKKINVAPHVLPRLAKYSFLNKSFIQIKSKELTLSLLSLPLSVPTQTNGHCDQVIDHIYQAKSSLSFLLCDSFVRSFPSLSPFLPLAYQSKLEVKPRFTLETSVRGREKESQNYNLVKGKIINLAVP